MDDDELVESGIHEELLACDGLYAMLWGPDRDIDARPRDVLERSGAVPEDRR